MSDADPRTRESVDVKPRRRTQRPSLYRVLLHNDHYTTMEFVVQVLESIFNKLGPEAVRIMLNVHENGVGIAGIYTAEVAETKVGTAHSLAQEHGYPLKCTMEPE